MNPISAFWVHNLIFVFFFYGLAFFTMGLALLLARRRRSTFQLAIAIDPLATFALLHAAHEWVEMFQQIALRTTGYQIGVVEEGVRLLLLVGSFGALLWFGAASLPNQHGWLRYWPMGGPVLLWLVSLLAVLFVWRPPMLAWFDLIDVLSRYLLCIPGTVWGAWALMQQQHRFREQNLSQFSRDLVWCASTLLLYGVIGQLFVRPTLFLPFTLLHSGTFLAWFGIPVQLFRAVMAGAFTFYLVKALRVFDVESQRRLDEANHNRLVAQSQALEAERRSVIEISRLNDELRLTTRELALLLELSNLLVTPQPLPERLTAVLEKVVENLQFTDAGLILLIDRETTERRAVAHTGFADVTHLDDGVSRYSLTLALGRRSIEQAQALCSHADGQVLEIELEVNLLHQACAQYESPTLYIALPLYAQQQVIGSLALARTKASTLRLTPDELRLITGIVQQLGLSIENARLAQQAQLREKILGELLYQVVGAQEAERQRIARELHDATGQSLTAIALGLRGLERLTSTGSRVAPQQIRDLVNFATAALGELRHLIADLRPSQLDDLGLVAALRWYVQEYERRHLLPVDFVVEGENIRLPTDYETVIFRIIQEALTNVAKHAQATQVTLAIAIQQERIRVTVTDNGCGFDLAALPTEQGQRVGWGLLGMRERALLLGGHCEIQSMPRLGTTIQVEIPLLTSDD